MEGLEERKREKKHVSGKKKLSVLLPLMRVGRLRAVHSPCLAYFYFIRHAAERITGTEGSQS